MTLTFKEAPSYVSYQENKFIVELWKEQSSIVPWNQYASVTDKKCDSYTSALFPVYCYIVDSQYSTFFFDLYDDTLV